MVKSSCEITHCFVSSFAFTSHKETKTKENWEPIIRWPIWFFLSDCKNSLSLPTMAECPFLKIFGLCLYSINVISMFLFFSSLTHFYFPTKEFYFKVTLGWKGCEFHQSCNHWAIFKDHLPYSVEQALPCVWEL